MASQLLHPGRGIGTSRTTVLVAIIAAHVGAIGVALAVRGPQPDAEPTQSIVVSLLVEDRQESPAPQLPLPTLEVTLPNIVQPLVRIDLPQEAPAAIAVAANPAPAAPAAPAVAGDSGEPIVATSVEYVRAPVASYPPAARQARASGTVYVRALVETDGHVRDARVHRSSGHAALDRAASESVLGALFKPYMRDGVAREALVIVPIAFSLKVRGAGPAKAPHARDDCGRPDRRGGEHRDESCIRDSNNADGPASAFNLSAGDPGP